MNSIQNKLLAKHGYYNIAPLWNEYDQLCGRWCYQKEGRFHVIDGYLSERKLGEVLSCGCVLLQLCDDGYHICTSSSNDKSSFYSTEKSKYFIVYETNEYSELYYLENPNVDKKTFEFLETQNYLSLLFHKITFDKGVLSITLDKYGDEIRLDCIVSKNKDILYEDVFSYFHENFIVIYDGETTFVYDDKWNIKYEREDSLKIWEIQEKVYLIFLSDKVVYDLIEGKEIRLDLQNGCDWCFAWAYQNYIIFYEQNYYRMERSESYYDDDDWGYYEEPIDVPVRNTIGHVFDPSFNLLREFNALGKIYQVTEVGNLIVMKTVSYAENGDVDYYYNIDMPNIISHNSKTNEDFSVPDISFKQLNRKEELYIVKTRVASQDTIDLGTELPTDFCAEKCGVYWRYNEEKYIKIVDCKYDYIVDLSLNKDEYIYYAGIDYKEECGKFDLYVNNKILLKKLPFIKEASSLKIVNNKLFIQYKNQDGNVGVIRNGDIILEPLYKEVSIHVKNNYSFINDCDENELEFLFIVSDGKYEGICSPKGRLIIPIEYHIYIDNYLNVILEHNDRFEFEVGYYDEETETFKHTEVEMEDGVIHLSEDYIWDGCFRDLNNDDISIWTDQELRDAADIAYEGYSRTYLGLDD